MESPRVQLSRPGEPSLPKHVRDLITKARASWLKNTEVLDLLQNYSRYNFKLNREAPDCPPGGTLYLFNRKVTRFFRRDGHNWRKKSDGKTIRETHEKLKVGNKEVLNCYYAHADQEDQLQRRCYWMLDGDDSIVLVHYLAANPAARLRTAGGGSHPLTAANLNAAMMQPRGMEAASSSDTSSIASFRSESRSTASSFSDLSDFGRAGSAPDRLGSFTFGSSSVRQASDGRCHFTITTGNTRPGPTDVALAQEGLGAMSGLAIGRDGGAVAIEDGRASSLPSTLGDALQRAQMEAARQQHLAQSFAGGLGLGRAQSSGFWGAHAGGSSLPPAQNQASAAAASYRHQQQQPRQQAPEQAAAEAAAAALVAWQQRQQQLAAAHQVDARHAQLNAYQSSADAHTGGPVDPRRQQHPHEQLPASAATSVSAFQLPRSHDAFQQQARQAQHGQQARDYGGVSSGFPTQTGSLPWQAAPEGGRQQAGAAAGSGGGGGGSGGFDSRPRLPAAGISAFAAPQVQGRGKSAFAKAATSGRGPAPMADNSALGTAGQPPQPAGGQRISANSALPVSAALGAPVATMSSGPHGSLNGGGAGSHPG